VTLPALVFCCVYASGALGSVAPKSWHPIDTPGPAPKPVSQPPSVLSASQTRHLGVQLPDHRIFGAAISGKALAAWYAGPTINYKPYEGTYVHPQLLMTFQSWQGQPMPTKFLSEDMKIGIHAQMFTWEPWRAPHLHSSVTQQESAQPKYSNKAIADGKWDDYITKWAQAVARFPKITVYVRFGHEMNGFWYPWSLDPHEYVLVWRHIWNIFQQQHVTNARFVWSADFGEGAPYPAWQQNLLAYWPGKKYVADVGTTVINFGGIDAHTVAAFTPRIDLVHQLLHMPVMLTEVNTAKQGRAQWLLDLASYVAHTPWISGVVLSQDPSYGAANMRTGNLSWQVSEDKSERAREAFIDLVWAVFHPAKPAATHPSTGA
jgi:hypothetical protein